MLTTPRFQDKVALVTGGGSGIGRATAMRLAQEGANIVIADIDPQKANQTVDDVRKTGRSALALETDISNYAECELMAKDISNHFGRLDVVFANAGISGGGSVQEMPEWYWNRVIATNLNGTFYTCKTTIPLLIQHKGAIVTMASSMAGWDTSLNGAAYMASKEGIVGLTKSLALQMAGYGVRVNAVCPGIIKTNLGRTADMTDELLEERYEKFAKRIPMRRVGSVEDVAAAVAYLASDDARHITGSALLIDGGQTLQSWSNAPDAETYPFYQ